MHLWFERAFLAVPRPTCVIFGIWSLVVELSDLLQGVGSSAGENSQSSGSLLDWVAHAFSIAGPSIWNGFPLKIRLLWRGRLLKSKFSFCGCPGNVSE